MLYSLIRAACPKTSPAVLLVTSNTANISWARPIGIRNYRFQVRLSSEYFIDASSSWSNSTSTLLTGLAPSTTYSGRVSSVALVHDNIPGHDCQERLSDAFTFTTLPSKPLGPPTQITTMNVTAKFIAVQWSPPLLSLRGAGITNYTLSINSSLNGMLHSTTVTVQNTSVAYESTFSYTFNNLTSMTKYSISIYATNVMGAGPTAVTSETTANRCKFFSYVTSL